MMVITADDGRWRGAEMRAIFLELGWRFRGAKLC